MTLRRWHIAVLLALLAATGMPPHGAVAADIYIRAGRYVAPDGALIDGPLISIESGKITEVRTDGDVPTGKNVVEYPDAVIVPGLIDVHSALTAAGNDFENANALEPAARAADFFDRYHRDLHHALRHGITTVVLAPAGADLICGRTAIAKTWCNPSAGPASLDDGPFKFSFAPQVFQPLREPTSRAGALDLLRHTLDAARSAGASNPLHALFDKQTTTIAECPERLDVTDALALGDAFGLHLAIVHDADAMELAPQLASAVAAAIVPPLDYSSPAKTLTGPATLERAGVITALAGMTPYRDADQLRLSAALAVRYGFSPKAARRAITVDAAQIAGIQGRTGSIAPGKEADLVIFSGDPLLLGSRIMAVYVGGLCVVTE